MKKIVLNETQEKIIISKIINENKYYTVDTNKVLVIKNFLDKNFKRASMTEFNEDGELNNTPMVGLMDDNGNVIKNMSDRQLFDYLQNKFHNIYGNNIQRDKFIAQVIKDWYYKKITEEKASK